MTDFNQKTHDTDVGSHGGQSRQMMEVFENQEFGSIRLLQEAGKTFFCASDVAKALGYVNPYAAVKRHCRGPLTKREGVVQKVNQYGDAGEQVVEISFITEGDVYRLIVHSKLPSAERFEHWVFDEVLPSIRKHGVYMSDSILDQVIQHEETDYRLKGVLPMADNKQHDTRTTRRPDCVTEIRMGNSVLVVSGYFKKDTTTTAADKMARVLEAEAAATQEPTYPA